MKAFAFAVIVLLATTAVAQTDTTALVEASKEAKSKRKTSTTKVITNADVKKSKGKLTQKPASKSAPETKKEQGLVEKHEADRTTRLAAEERLAVAQARVTELETELARIEKSYYEENDLDRRDRVITKQFEDVKARLEEARKELSALNGAAGSQPAETPADPAG